MPRMSCLKMFMLLSAGVCQVYAAEAPSDLIIQTDSSLKQPWQTPATSVAQSGLHHTAQGSYYLDVPQDAVKAPLRWVIVLKQPALAVTTLDASWSTRRQQIHAAQDQLIQKLKNAQLVSTVTRRFNYLINAIVVTGDAKAIASARAWPEVQSIHRDYAVHALLTDSVPMIGAPKVWQKTDPSGNPVTGKGRVIAIIDTGIDYTHPDLGGCLGPSCKVIGGYDIANNDPDPKDDQGHGTHVAGIAAANGTLRGVAYEASLLAYKVLDQQGSGSMSDVIAGVEKACDPDGNPATNDKADVINLSLGGEGDPTDPLAVAVNNAVSLGVIVVAAAGNAYNYQTIGSPALAEQAIAVAAVDKQGKLANFSSKGPVPGYNQLIKPEISAPGVDILSTIPGGGYMSASGTSMAAPHIAGAAALLKQLYPKEPASSFKQRLMTHAKALPYDIYSQGAGLVALDKAIQPNVVMLTPAAVALGRVPHNDPVWMVRRDVVIKNEAPFRRSFAINTESALPPGVSVQIEPSDITIDQGQSKSVSVFLKADNAQLPFPTELPLAFEVTLKVAKKGVSPDEVPAYRLPLVFHKALTLNFEVEQPEALTTLALLSRSGKFSAFINGPITQAQHVIQAPPGVYDILASYQDEAAQKISSKDAIHVGRDIVLPITPLDAIYRDSLGSVTDEEGQSIPISELSVQSFVSITHVSGEFAYVTSSSTVAQHRFAPLTGFRVEHSYLLQRQQKIYEAYHDAKTGLQGDVTLHADARNLKKLSFDIASKQQAETLLPSYCTQMFIFIQCPMITDSDAFDFFLAPKEDPGMFWHFMAARTSSFNLLAVTPYISADNGQDFQAYLRTPKFQLLPVYKSSAGRIALGQRPRYWSGEFDNKPREVVITPSRKGLSPLHSLVMEADHGAIYAKPSYRLKTASGSLLDEGVLGDELFKSITVNDALAQPLILETQYHGGRLQAFINGLNNADANPPVITNVTLQEEGIAVDVDDSALAKVTIGIVHHAAFDAEIAPLAVIERDGHAYVKLTCSDVRDRESYLSVKAIDKTGNYSHNLMRLSEIAGCGQ